MEMVPELAKNREWVKFIEENEEILRDFVDPDYCAYAAKQILDD